MSIVEMEAPWYFSPDLAIEQDRELVEPFVAKPDDHEWSLLRAYDTLRAEIVAETRPLQNQLARRSILEKAIALAIVYRGGAILAGSLFAYSDGVGVEVVRSPSYPSTMTRQNPGKAKAPTPKPSPARTVEYYEPPADPSEGDLRGTARTVGGRVVWSAKTLWAVIGRKDVDLAMARVRYLTPIGQHPALFPSLRARSNGRHLTLVCVTVEGLKALSPFVSGPAAETLREYLESAG